MIRRLIDISRLIRMFRLIAAQDAFLPPDFKYAAPASVKLARIIFTLGAPRFSEKNRSNALSDYIRKLGPSYIKFGQLFATRPDLVGEAMAADLQHLQDDLPPFAKMHVDALLAQELEPHARPFRALSPPVAAASVAQVHKAKSRIAPDTYYAVKILRPHIHKIVARELGAFRFCARVSEKLIPSTRRLKLVETVDMLERVVSMELDLRYEAAALSRMQQNCTATPGFRVPTIIWQGTGKNVLTMQWIDGISAADIDALKAAGHDMEKLATTLIHSFLYHTLNDGFFHADMHQGNLLIEATGDIIALDWGITGHIDKQTQLYLAQILHGFVISDYIKVAHAHFDAGYVPADQSVDKFAQALRFIGAPIRNQKAGDISIAHFLSKLFEVAAQFNMQTQIQLLLLQKTMVVVEGVARSFYPDINFWDIAEAVITDWFKRNMGPRRIIDEAKIMLKTAQHMPRLIEKIEKSLEEQPPPPTPDYVARFLALLALCAALGVGVYYGMAL